MSWKRPPKMQLLEKAEVSAKGISYLTTRSVYDWRKKPYQVGDGISVQWWKGRSRLVAREFAFSEGKRDYILSPATSGHVLKLLPTIFLQRISEEEEAREGEAAFWQALGCLDVSWSAVIIMINTIGFAAATFALWKPYKRIERRYDELYYREEKR